MRPKFNFNPASVVATNRIYEGEGFELLVGESTPFYFEGKNGKSDSFGVKCVCTIAEGEYKGEKYEWFNWMHSEGGLRMTKVFQMAVLGYSNDTDSEQVFNIETQGFDWSIDFDNKTVGDGWHQLSGHRISVDFEKGINADTGGSNQKFKNLKGVA